MKILAWNCRGLSSSRAVHSLLDVQKQVRPDVCFLSETHLDKAKAEKVRRRASFDKMIVHESNGRSGACC
jgi:exonuclease III